MALTDDINEKYKRSFSFDNSGNLSGTEDGFTFTLNHFFVIAAGILFLLLIIHLYCNYCRKSDDKKEDDETQSLVIASEVKPGYLIIQGNSNEEIFRIIKEYETAHGKNSDTSASQSIAGSSSSAHHYGLAGEQYVPNFLQQETPLLGRNAPFYGQTSGSSAPGTETMMMEYNTTASNRPPPYAPTEHWH